MSLDWVAEAVVAYSSRMHGAMHTRTMAHMCRPSQWGVCLHSTPISAWAARARPGDVLGAGRAARVSVGSTAATLCLPME